MKPLLDSVQWQAREHPARSRGMAASGADGPAPDPQPREDRTEECCVLTRSPRVLFLSLPRSKIFHPQLPAPSALLWWRAVSNALLAELHDACLRVCAEVGLSEFCLMCHAGGLAARRYWKEMLGENLKYLRWRF
jgi:hypothetical protein